MEFRNWMFFLKTYHDQKWMREKFVLSISGTSKKCSSNMQRLSVAHRICLSCLLITLSHFSTIKLFLLYLLILWRGFTPSTFNHKFHPLNDPLLFWLFLLNRFSPDGGHSNESCTNLPPMIEKRQKMDLNSFFVRIWCLHLKEYYKLLRKMSINNNIIVANEC